MSIYVITHYVFNHKLRKNCKPFDSRFLESDKNYIFYLIDQEVPDCLRNKKVIFEKKIDPLFYEAGKKHLAEWSFLLSEYKNHFCEYPFFMISSRFYEKNTWIYRDLTAEWDLLFSFFNQFDYGFLPSYDRPMRWVDLNWGKIFRKKIYEYRFIPYHYSTIELLEKMYQFKMPQDWPRTTDLSCNYIGFKNRKALEDYVKFYLPLIHFFFNENFEPIKNLKDYVKDMGAFPNEKPFTFVLELFSRLFFFKTNKKLFSLQYDGYYSIDEKASKFEKFHSFNLSWHIILKRFFIWQKRKLVTEGCYSFLRYKVIKFAKKILRYKKKSARVA